MEANLRAIAALLLVVAASPVFGQGGPSLDCAKASTAIQRAICGNAELAAAERAMSAAYAALLGKLGGPARVHLVADQARWLANRERACVGEPADVEECLEARCRDRIGRLKLFADGAYPFVSEQAIVEAGEVRGIPYRIDASYPRFDGGSADFSAVNRQFAAAARQAADRVVPGPRADTGGGKYNGPAWGYEQAYTLHRPGPDALTVAVVYDSYEGGTNSVVGIVGTLVDLRSGKAVGPEGVFAPGADWLKELTRLARADIKAANLPDLLKNPSRYVFLEDRLELSFNQNEGGPYTLEIPYDRLKPLLRDDGPIPR